MSNKKEQRGDRDRGQRTSNHNWELDDIIQTTGATREEVEEAIKKVGNSKEKVERYLKNKRIF